MKPDITEIVKLPALQAAPLLLGCILERRISDKLLRLKIVETEAYHQEDPASHSYRGLTKRTAPMFEAGGTIYIYFTYGLHYCLNIVTGEKGVGEAVLIRAAEPLAGIPVMKKLRNQESRHRLANGPANLAQAIGITSTELSGTRISEHTINLLPREAPVDSYEIIAGPRVGITKAKELAWRFTLRNSIFTSKL